MIKHELQIADTIRIESPEQLSEELIRAGVEDAPVLPFGGGTSLATGYPVEHTFTALDMTGMGGVVDYVPTDMTAAFLAGTPVRDVKAILAEHGQELPVDVPDDDGTIGGLIATGYASQRAYAQGTLKDLLIGCEYVRGDGLIAKAGGMTVKNVSGFEITRLLHSSWGALAVLTRVNLKVLPKYRADHTLVFHDGDMSAAFARQQRLVERYPGATAFRSMRTTDGWQTAIRFAGRESSVEAYIEDTMNAEGEADRHTGSTHPVWTEDHANPAPLLVVSVTAEEGGQVTKLLAQADGVASLAFSLGTGTVHAGLNVEDFDAGLFATLPGNLWRIERGTDTWKHGLPVWGPERGDIVVMKSIKNEFDPKGVLNRGRLFI